MKKIYFLALFIIIAFSIKAQNCADEQIQVIYTIKTDKYSEETSWSLKGGDGTVYVNQLSSTLTDLTVYSDTFCITAGLCDTFTIKDTYGDGLSNSQGPNGWYVLLVDGDTIASGVNFGYKAITVFDCAPGTTCSEALPITAGTYTAPAADSWYVFTADSIGFYTISTCDLDNTCDTKIWVYDACNYASIGPTIAGTTFYDDNDGGCGQFAVVSTVLDAGKTIYIRIGGACEDTINFLINYGGPVTGCMDPTACNFNPLASVDDGGCIAQGSLNCPDGPDLWMVQEDLLNSLEADVINNVDGCLVNEGCLSGFGQRELIRFDTHIKNIGELDYFIGVPTLASNQFTYDNCHNHYHYEGYAEYLVYDTLGNLLPMGFKNGFCVLDLVCQDGGIAKFSCGNMGITAGCGDVYDSYLDCQWIDVTDLPDGKYLLVTRVNWDNSPDKLGRVEKTIENNWAQVCLNIDRSSGSLQFTVDTDCPVFLDCMGVSNGSNQPDCNGECGGTAIRGDIDENNVADMTDAMNYVTKILGNDITATPCNDLSGDGIIDVYDADLLASCLNYGTNHIHPGSGQHDHCQFPDGVLNFMDTVSLRILDFNTNDKTIIIGMKNPADKVVSYQFKMSGVVLQSVTNLVDESFYPITPSANISDAEIIGISYQDSSINKSEEWLPILSLKYGNIIGDEVCIEKINKIINKDHHEVISKIEGGCINYQQALGNNDLDKIMNVRVQPNPFNSQTRISFNNTKGEFFSFQLLDLSGRIVKQLDKINNEEIILSSDGLSNGMYIYQLISKNGIVSGKLIIE